jgi:crotonobetainyl-CoA:carnitine CoA-transferase CaiB-like acyl-CoA transferase
MIALHDRERTGRGQWVKVSLLEAMISFLDFQAVRYTIDGHVPATEGNHHPTLRPMGTYRAADGHLNIAAPGEKFWRRLCAVLDDEALATEERFATPQLRYTNRLELDVELDDRLGRRPRDEWIARLDAAGIPCGPVNAIDEVFADPQVQHLAMLATVDHATRGPVDVLRTPITMSRSTPVVPTAAPMPGADPDAVLDALGIPRAD